MQSWIDILEAVPPGARDRVPGLSRWLAALKHSPDQRRMWVGLRLLASRSQAASGRMQGGGQPQQRSVLAPLWRLLSAVVLDLCTALYLLCPISASSSKFSAEFSIFNEQERAHLALMELDLLELLRLARDASVSVRPCMHACLLTKNWHSC